MRFARRYDCRTHCTSKAVRFLIPGAIPLLLAWGPLAIVEAQTAGHKIYVANYASDTLGVFPINANGNVASLFQRIRLSNPGGIAYHAGNLYVANHSNDSITIFPANATGRPNTISTIRGSNTQLYNPGPITVDGAGTIYVINTGSQDERPTITSYAAGSHGDVSPKTVIKGPHARLDGPSAIATDAQGNIYVTTTSADQSHDSILVFSSGSNGNASPARVISGAASRVRMPGGIAVSAKGYIYVTTEQVTGGYNGVEILIFGPGTNGDTAPVTRIDGGCDPSVPTAGPVALGSDNQIYVLTTELNPERRKIVALVNEVESTLNTKFPPYICGNNEASLSEWNSGLVDSYSFAIDPTGNMYLADSEQNTVSILPAGSNGEVKPVAKFGGDTGIVAPTGVALDAQGKIYVANDGVATGHPESDNVTIYPAGSNAIAAPIGGSSNYSSPQAIAVDSDGTTYVANGTGGVHLRGDISIVPRSLEGKAKVRMISGTAANDVTRLYDPSGLAVDHDGNLYVVNNGSQSITVYGPRADGDDPPIRTISGDKTKLDSPQGIALDAAGKIYVTNDGGIRPDGADSINMYAPNTSGNVAPIAIISGPKTQLKLPQGIAVDTDGKIYVANDGNLDDRAEDASRYDDRPRADPADSITVYAPGSNGNVAPLARINGPLTGLGHPMGIAVGP